MQSESVAANARFTDKWNEMSDLARIPTLVTDVDVSDMQTSQVNLRWNFASEPHFTY